ncbi:hypothetical protein, partial [Escherichia coli]|uniref:hypothetical protein n=1 Tax=Escherichia coli TaxID=562 RepID=UPI00207C5206
VVVDKDKVEVVVVKAMEEEEVEDSMEEEDPHQHASIVEILDITLWSVISLLGLEGICFLFHLLCLCGGDQR